MARQKKDTSINIDAQTVSQISTWQAFIEGHSGFTFKGIKLIPNEAEDGFVVAHATGVDVNGTATEFTEVHRQLFEQQTNNVTALKAG